MRICAGFVSLACLLVMCTAGFADALPQAESSFTTRVLELTNVERQQAGLSPLAPSSQLSNAAQTYSQVLASSACFDHTCGPVPNFADRLADAGYTGWTAIGENIAAGFSTPEAVVAGWMLSPGHRANILSPRYTEMGVGLVSSGGAFGTYWSEEFGTRPTQALRWSPLPWSDGSLRSSSSVDS